MSRDQLHLIYHLNQRICKWTLQSGSWRRYKQIVLTWFMSIVFDGESNNRILCYRIHCSHQNHQSNETVEYWKWYVKRRSLDTHLAYSQWTLRQAHLWTGWSISAVCFDTNDYIDYTRWTTIFSSIYSTAHHSKTFHMLLFTSLVIELFAFSVLSVKL